MNDRPKEPQIHCTMFGMGMGLGLDDETAATGGGAEPTPPGHIFPFGGQLGVYGFGFFVFGAQEDFS